MCDRMPFLLLVFARDRTTLHFLLLSFFLHKIINENQLRLYPVLHKQR
jgi:hypothetical protein